MALKAPRPLEKHIQRDILSYLRMLRIFAAAVPNGSVLAGDAKSRAMQSAALKRSGMVPGFADLILFKRGQHHPLVGLLEVKREGEKLKPAQVEFQAVCEAYGLPFAVVRSVEDAKQTLTEWGWL
jgi:hypothetical protein